MGVQQNLAENKRLVSCTTWGVSHNSDLTSHVSLRKNCPRTSKLSAPMTDTIADDNGNPVPKDGSECYTKQEVKRLHSLRENVDIFLSHEPPLDMATRIHAKYAGAILTTTNLTHADELRDRVEFHTPKYLPGGGRQLERFSRQPSVARSPHKPSSKHSFGM
jgi:hypothetical protein